MIMEQIVKPTWSKYQKEIFDTYQNKDCDIAISAVPGSGKSTTLIQLCKLTNRHCESVFLAFNRSIVEELKLKVPPHIKVSTLHGLGYGALRKAYGPMKVSEYKTFGVLKTLEKKWEVDLKEIDSINGYFFELSQLYDLYRMNLLTTVDDRVSQLADKHSILINTNTLKHLQELVDVMKQINSKLRPQSEIDYVDMIYLPVVNNLTMWKYDRVFVDEAQDLNRCQHELVRRIRKKVSKLVVCGQAEQCIYSFLGASPEMFQEFKLAPSTISLPLSITYRCGKKIVEKVNTVFHTVETLDTMEDGEVEENGRLESVKYGDMLLCRNNKPLLEAYFKLIVDGKKAWIRGVEFGKGLERMIEKYKNTTTDHCIECLYDQLDELEEKLFERGIRKPTSHSSYVTFEENIQLLKIIGERYDYIRDVIPVVQEIFKDKGEGIMLSTVHKAKGLEANNVYILFPGLIPSKYATQPWELQQEMNLKYVAFSRAKKKLSFINNLD